MFTFLLVSSSSRRLDIRMLIEGLGITHKEQGDRYIAYGPTGMKDGWIAIERIENGEGEFDEAELDLIRKSIADPTFFLVEGRNGVINFSDFFVLGLSQEQRFLIDNDHGLIENAENLKLRIREGRDWLRSDS